MMYLRSLASTLASAKSLEINRKAKQGKGGISYVENLQCP